MSKIIYIADPEILAVPIEECNEPLVDIKNSDQLQYGTPPECELTTNDYTKMRKTVFEKIIAAQKDLPNGYYFRIYEGYRSLLVQKMLFEQEYQRVTKHSPNK
jgi:D-alanyl-D-alanine dipeptidase